MNKKFCIQRFLNFPSYRVVLIIIIFAFVATFIAFGSSAYPALSGDARSFVVPAINYYLGNGLVAGNFNDLSIIVDPSGQNRFLFYVPFYPLVLGWILNIFPKASFSPQYSFLVIAALNSLVFVASAFLFMRVATFKKKLNAFSFFVIVISLVGLASLLHRNYRPEVLAHIFFVAGIIMPFIISNKRKLWLPLGVLAGLMGATQAVGAVGSLLLIFIFFSLIFKFKELIVHLALVSLTSLITFLLVMQLSPFSLSDTLGGMLLHASNAFKNDSPINFILSAFGGGSAFVISFSIMGIFIIFLVICVKLFIRYRSNISSPIILVVFGLAWLAFQYYFTISRGTLYNLTLFFILFFAVVIYYLVNERSGIVLKLTSGFFIIMLGLIFIRSALLFPFFIKDGVSLGQARESFAELEEFSQGKRIDIPWNLWPLTEKYKKNIYIWPAVYTEQERSDIFLLEQDHHNLLSPPDEFRGCVLKDDFFVRKTPRLLGLKLFNVTPGYAYASYNCPKTVN